MARHGTEALRLIDATPIPLTGLHKWAAWNDRTRGLKAHVVYDPNADRRCISSSPRQPLTTS